MATDEAIWRAVVEKKAPPTLRLYAWTPPCLSIGRNQSVTEVDRQALRDAGYDLVRRPTGGRAILHADELTYCLVTPLSDPRVRGSVADSCAQLSGGLLAALQRLGARDVAAHQGRRTRRTAAAPVCFEHPAEFEITMGGRKLVGSAQMRGRDVLLQHGAIPLCGDIARICACLVTAPDPQRLRARAATLECALNRPVTWEEAAAAIVEGFQQALNLQLQPAPLTAAERALVPRLRTGKYQAAEWTARIRE